MTWAPEPCGFGVRIAHQGNNDLPLHTCASSVPSDEADLEGAVRWGFLSDQRKGAGGLLSVSSTIGKLEVKESLCGMFQEKVPPLNRLVTLIVVR